MSETERALFWLVAGSMGLGLVVLVRVLVEGSPL